MGEGEEGLEERGRWRREKREGGGGWEGEVMRHSLDRASQRGEMRSKRGRERMGMRYTRKKLNK